MNAQIEPTLLTMPPPHHHHHHHNPSHLHQSLAAPPLPTLDSPSVRGNILNYVRSIDLSFCREMALLTGVKCAEGENNKANTLQSRAVVKTKIQKKTKRLKD